MKPAADIDFSPRLIAIRDQPEPTPGEKIVAEMSKCILAVQDRIRADANTARHAIDNAEHAGLATCEDLLAGISRTLTDSEKLLNHARDFAEHVAAMKGGA